MFYVTWLGSDYMTYNNRVVDIVLLFEVGNSLEILIENVFLIQLNYKHQCFLQENILKLKEIVIKYNDDMLLISLNGKISICSFRYMHKCSQTT